MLGAANAQQTNLNGSYVGIFIPLNAKGFLLDLGARLATSSGGTEYVQIFCSPTPNLAPIFSGTLTVVGLALADYTTAIMKFWNYDSIFIYIQVPSNTLIVAYQNTSNQGLSAPPLNPPLIPTIEWTGGVNSYDIWADFVNLPQSIQEIAGIVNNIEIPTASSAVDQEGYQIPVNQDTQMAYVIGTGTCDYMLFVVEAAANSQVTYIIVKCDGNLVLDTNFATLNNYGFTPSTPAVSLLNYNVDGKCSVLITKKFNFQQSLEVIVYNGASKQTVTLIMIPSVIS